MTDELIDSLDLIRSQPIILQRYIQKMSELRVTCIGNEIFVARQLPLDTSTEAVDWRSLQDNDSRYDADFTLPTHIIDGIRRIMHAYDLGFSAIDFAVDHQGDIHFLEVNPNGQWLGYTDEIGLPAAASMAKHLVNRTRCLQ
jgi:glutathione synthase/RimK-type ligase-like ATP-grasp enzyme